jgi:uncharacterized protein YndB with AHSA1/START domain
MSTQSFTTTISVDQSPQEVFDAINDVRGWWTGEVQGKTDEVGAEFEYRYKDFHRTTQKITELVPGRKVVWHVVSSQLPFFKNPKEWDGTDIVFDISKKNGKTEVRFTHAGLVPAIECYNDCSSAWGQLVRDNLRKLIASRRANLG